MVAGEVADTLGVTGLAGDTFIARAGDEVGEGSISGSFSSGALGGVGLRDLLSALDSALSGDGDGDAELGVITIGNGTEDDAGEIACPRGKELGIITIGNGTEGDAGEIACPPGGAIDGKGAVTEVPGGGAAEAGMAGNSVSFVNSLYIFWASFTK